MGNYGPFFVPSGINVGKENYACQMIGAKCVEQLPDEISQEIESKLGSIWGIRSGG